MSAAEAVPPPRPTVCLTLDFDAESIWIMLGLTGARSISRGEFGGRTGAPRLLDLCDRHGISSTWFVPGHTADTYPEITREVCRRGHELANHGYLHEDFAALDLEQARTALRKGNAALERISGLQPEGVRLGGGDFDGGIMEVLVEEGFTWDSSLLGEYRPHWCRSRDTLEGVDARIVRGCPLDLVELPVSFVTSDFVNFEVNYAAPAVPSRLRNPRDIEDIWQQELDALLTHEPAGALMLMLHPQVIGRGSRFTMLERFVEHCLAQPGLRFATCGTVAAEFRAAEAARGRTQP